MKAEVKQKEVAFEPIELVITIESVEDVKTLYHIFDMSMKAISDKSKGSLVELDVYQVAPIDEVWSVIDELATGLNLKK